MQEFKKGAVIKMSNLYLHIGTPKTGTSAIQKFLRLNENLLKKQGFCYPDLGYRYSGVGENRNAHFMVHRENFYSMSDEEAADFRKSEDERFYEGLDKLKEISKEYPNIILSDENIWNGYVKRKDFWRVLKQGLDERNIGLKVIVYLRRQDLAIESYYVQRVKDKLQLDFDEYIASEKYKYFKLDYYSALEKIAEFTGKENIIVRVYEKQQFEGKNNSLISDFLSVLGLEYDSKWNMDIVANTGVYGSFLEVKRILNKIEYFRKPNWTVKYLRTIQEETDGGDKLSECRYFTYEGQMDFLSKFEASNQAVAREYLNRCDGILFRDEIPERSSPKQEYSKDELVYICGKMLELEAKDMNRKLESTQTKLEETKRRLKYYQRPLYRKIGGKVLSLFNKVRKSK